MNCQDKKAKFNWTEEQYNKCLQKEQLETPPNQELNPLTGLGLEVDIDIDEAIKNTPEKKPELSWGDKINALVNVASVGSEIYADNEKLKNLENINFVSGINFGLKESGFGEGKNEFYDPAVLKEIASNLSTNDITKFTEKENDFFSKWGYTVAKSASSDPDYEPSTLAIWDEARRLKILSLQDATGEKSTIVENMIGKDGLGNFFGDVYRASKSGVVMSDSLDSSLEIFSSGGVVETDKLLKFLEDQKNNVIANNTSDEMKKFESCYADAGQSSMGFLKCLYQNPSVISQVVVNSAVLNGGAVIQSDEVKKSAIAGTAVGAVAGGPTGALAGFFMASGYSLEAGLKFAELLIAETGIDDVNNITVDDLQKVLNDPEKFDKIQTKARNRGIVIGVASGLSAGVASKAVSGLVKAGKSTRVAAAVGTGVEVIGEGVGEAAGQLAAGEKIDMKEVYFEMVGSVGSKAPVSVGGTLLNLQQTSTNIKVGRLVKANGFTSVSSAFDPNIESNETQLDVTKIPNSEKTLAFELENNIKRRVISREDASSVMQRFQEVKATGKQIEPLKLKNKTDQTKIINLLVEKKELTGVINKVNDENLTESEAKRVEAINLELNDVIANSEKIEPVAFSEVKATETKSSGFETTEGKKINDLVGPRKENGEYDVTKKEWDSGIREKVIGNIYENELLQGLVKKQITQEMKSLPQFSPEDFVSATITELIPHIRNFNPEINNSLSGWINSELNNKKLNALKKGKSGTEQVFTSDVTEARNVTDSESITIEQKIDLKDKVKVAENKAIQKLREVIGVTPEETKVIGDKIIGGKIRTEPVKGVSNPAMRDVGKAGTLLQSEKIIESMGGKIGTVGKNNDLGNYTTFLEVQGEDILTVLNSEDLNEIKNTKLKDLYKPKQVDRARGVQNVKGAGKGVFEYENAEPTVKDLITWATDDSLPATTKIARQQTLADILGNALGRVSTAEAVKPLKDGGVSEGSKKFVETQKLLGEEITPDKLAKFIANIDIKIKSLEKTRKQKYAGRLGVNDIPAIVNKSLILALKLFKKALQNGVNWIQALGQVTRGLAKKNVSASDVKIIQKVFQTYLTPKQLSGIEPVTPEQLQKAIEDAKLEFKMKNNGDAYEAAIIKGLLGLEKKIPGLEIKTRGKQANNLKGADVEMVVNGVPLNVELKAIFSESGNVQLGSITVNDLENLLVKKAGGLLDAGFPKEKLGDLLSIAAGIDIKSLQKLAESFGFKGKVLVDKMPESIYKKVKNADGLKNTNQPDPKGFAGFTMGEIGAIYRSKVPPVHYIQIKGKGLYHMGENPLNLNVPDISAQKVDFYARIAYATSTKDKQTGEKMISSVVRFTPRFVKGKGGTLDIETSKYSLDNPKSFANLINDSNVFVLGKDKVKANSVLDKGKDFLKNNPDAIPTTTDPVVLDSDINKMIEDTKGIKARYKFSDIVAKRRGAGFKNFKIIPSSAQDFSGLMYDLYSKGIKGEQQQEWVKENLIKPYQKGIAEIDSYRQALKNDYSSLLKKFPAIAKKLGKTVPGTEFTFDQALRVNLWTEGGFEIPGLAKRDIKKLNDIVNKDPELKLFNQAAIEISKRDKWVKPSAYWDSESLISDLNNLTNKVGRKQYLASFIENADVIFSKENLNKMEVALGTNWREAMEDSLYRMKNGTNRPSGTNKLTNQFNNWVNNSVGAIMFMNVKSALLQTISSVNFLNWSDNNPYKAALAFGNQKQYWSDFATLWNSPKLKQRRSGLRKDVNEAELANAAIGAKNKPQAILSYLLKIGFTPTQMADSFAIASGGATFYRNRINTLKNQGLDQKAAEEQAFEDFAEASDVAQQSADPMLISQQQASPLGRLILAFQNTPAQVTRIFNKSARDFINNRGDQKTNVSKMIYYGAVQGMIFATLQNAAFALIPGFDNEEDEEKKSKEFDVKEERILNSMVDTMLRGSGVYGAIVSTLKNTALTYYREEKKDAFSKDHRNTLLEILNLSPPVGSKVRKINNAIKAKDYNKEVVKEQGWDVTLKGKVNLSPSYQVIASLTEAITNLPLERAVVEIDRIVEVLDARNTTFQRIALALGYRTWDVNAKNEERDLVKIEAKERKEVARKQKVIDDRAERKRLKELEKYKGKTKDEIKQIKRRDSIVDTNKSDQVKSLINLGLTKKEIKELKYEDDRVNKIIELTNK